jgi:hypothetical protein
MTRQFLIFAASLLLALPAMAADPGDACTAAQADSWQVSTTDTDVHIYCDGTQWRTLRITDESGAATTRIKQNITFGNDSTACSANVEGTLRYTGGTPPWEYCDGSDWVPFERAGATSASCSAPALCPNVGDTCDDSNPATTNDPKFAGLMLYDDGSCEPLYVAQSDQGASDDWKTSTGSDDIATDSLNDGLINDSQIANSTTFPAFKLCKDLTDGGYPDWYLPARDELILVWKNKTDIGGFSTGPYWTSSEYTLTNSWTWEFEDIAQHYYGYYKNDNSRTRCVRRGSCPASGLVGHWRFDASTGTLAADSAGSNDGTLVNMDSSDWVSGKIRNALDFDGSDDYVNAGNSSSVGLTDNFTYAAWVKTELDSHVHSLYDKDSIGGDTSNTAQIKIWSSNYLILHKNNGATTGTLNTIPQNTWTHIAVTYASGTSKFYINGDLDNTDNTVTGTFTATTYDMYIGRRGNDTAENFNGQIDDVRIYNRVLSDGEIAELYNGGTGCY